MPTYTFREIKGSNTFRLRCTCGKRFQRTISETQTVNPFNKNVDGTVKTAQEVWQAVRDLLEGKEPNKACPACGTHDNVTVISQSGISWVA